MARYEAIDAERSMKTLVRVLVVTLTLLVGYASFAADVPHVNAETVLERTSNGDPSLVILDVRTPAEYAHGHVPGAINIPYDNIAARVDELLGAKDKDVVLYCHSGGRADVAARTLKARGFEKLLQLEGDWAKWTREKRPIEK
jgi:phage shock protein E